MMQLFVAESFSQLILDHKTANNIFSLYCIYCASSWGYKDPHQTKHKSSHPQTKICLCVLCYLILLPRVFLIFMQMKWYWFFTRKLKKEYNKNVANLCLWEFKIWIQHYINYWITLFYFYVIEYYTIQD